MANLRDHPAFDIGISISMLGLLCTVVLEVVKVHERIARLEQRIELYNAVSKDEYSGEMMLLRYRLTRLETAVLKQQHEEGNDGASR